MALLHAPTRMNVPSYQEVIGEGGAMYTVFVVDLATGKNKLCYQGSSRRVWLTLVDRLDS